MIKPYARLLKLLTEIRMVIVFAIYMPYLVFILLPAIFVGVVLTYSLAAVFEWKRKELKKIPSKINETLDTITETWN